MLFTATFTAAMGPMFADASVLKDGQAITATSQTSVIDWGNPQLICAGAGTCTLDMTPFTVTIWAFPSDSNVTHTAALYIYCDGSFQVQGTVSFWVAPTTLPAPTPAPTASPGQLVVVTPAPAPAIPTYQVSITYSSSQEMNCQAATWLPLLFGIGAQACYFPNIGQLVFPASNNPVLFTATFNVQSDYAYLSACVSIDNEPPFAATSQATCTSFCELTDPLACLDWNTHSSVMTAFPLDIGTSHTAAMYIYSYYTVEVQGTATLVAQTLSY
jgi:hypothetical protein